MFRFLCTARVCEALAQWYKKDPRHQEMHAAFRWCAKTREWIKREGK